MKKIRRRHKKRRKRLAARAGGALVATEGKRTRIRVGIEALELAKGHDGFLRGSPEPVIVTAAYLVEDGTARVLGRSIARFHRPARTSRRVHFVSPDERNDWTAEILFRP